MRVFRRRRILTIAAFVLVAGVMFLCFQLFSFEALDVHSRLDNLQSKFTYMKKKDIKLEQGVKPNRDFHLDDAELRKSKCLQGDCADEDVGKEAVVDKYHPSTMKSKTYKVGQTAARKQTQRQLHPSHQKNTAKSHPAPRDVSLNNLPRGILLNMASEYTSDNKGMFSCLHSQEQIPFTAVNDNYCDCKDGSDEPGTSACPDTKFYCAFQMSLDNPIWVTSSKVNDGICDCCDGSDEWANVTLPPHVKLKDGVAGYGLYQTPCSNRCHVLEARKQHLSDVRQRGLVLKQQYIEAGRSHIKPNQLYGPDGVFYKLSQECYSTTSDVYKYIVCPFKEIHQEGGTHGVNIIGREPRWLPGPADKPRLEMSSGSPRGCPDSVSRKSIVVFECGLEDKVLSVQEFEVCSYTIGFSTPAAC